MKSLSRVMSFQEDRLRDKRKEISCNLIVRGFAEEGEETGIQTKQKVSQLLQKAVPDANIVTAVRIGKPDPQRPRLVKITVDKFEARNSLLTECRRQRHGAFRNIFVDPDRTLPDRKEAFRLRQRLRQLRLQHPEKDVQLKRSILTVDGLEVDREQPLRHVFPID